MTRSGDYGGSARAVRQHYDMPDGFWRLVLGETMTYSSALFEPGDDLDAAQHHKLDWHLARGGEGKGRLLDVGCGWGSLLQRAAERRQLGDAVGLTLSETQYAWVRKLSLPNVDVRLGSWTAFQDTQPFDGIISIGAFEHFAKPSEALDEKRAVYRDFFERCRRWLKPQGKMTLQTIAFGTMKREEASDFMNNVIFPESDLPTLADVVDAAHGILEIVEVRNDRLHYAQTFDGWASNLRRHRAEAVAICGEEYVRTFERYLKMASIGFRMGKIWLLRFALRPIVEGNWSAANAGGPLTP